ncbi:hypothetical protein JW968_05340 [Candidatus Woesearchaeota archaeon]|nr:hypothetical protein [Candidatus Woesearchaeota archaeon]
MDRKGALTDTLRTIIGLAIFLAVLVFVLIPLGYDIYRIFVPVSEQGTDESLQKLGDGIIFLLGSDKAVCEIPFYIQPDFAIVGFPAQEAFVKETAGWFVDDKIFKPEVCGYKACICICHGGFGDVEGDDCREWNHCYPADDPHFDGLYLGRFEEDYPGFVLYGEEGFFGGDVGVAKLIINKTAPDKVVAGYRTDFTEEITNCAVLAPDSADS